MLNKICAMVVIYNPDSYVLERIDSYINYVDEVFLVDNGGGDYLKNEIKNSNFKDKLFYYTENENMGISSAINKIADIVYSKGYRWLLTMDQDSTFKNFEVINNYFQTDNENQGVGIYCPAHLTGRRVYPKDDISYIKSVMTSGNILNLDVFKLVGGCDERFFIDRVDHDLCASIIENGFYIKRVNHCELIHNLGEINLNIKYEVTNHSPLRRYYITRNTFYFIEKHLFKMPVYCLRYFFSFIVEIKNVYFYEKNRFDKTKYIILGFFHYIFRKSGKL